MVLTRSEARTAYTHILHNVFGRADGTPLQLALEEEGIEDVFGLVNLDSPTINNLAYSDSNNNNAITNARTGDKMLLKCFLSYIQVQHTEGNTIRDDWDQITHTEFDAFWIDPKYFITQTTKPSLMSPSASSSPKTYNASHFNPIEMFCRGIKRDATLFPALKDDKYHHIWHRLFQTHATAQAVSEVLDDSYAPTSQFNSSLCHQLLSQFCFKINFN
jgi:hypothetical protein